MNKELEKVCEEIVQKFETGDWDGTTRFKVEQGFKAAIESKQVQGLGVSKLNKYLLVGLLGVIVGFAGKNILKYYEKPEPYNIYEYKELQQLCDELSSQFKGYGAEIELNINSELTCLLKLGENWQYGFSKSDINSYLYIQKLVNNQRYVEPYLACKVDNGCDKLDFRDFMTCAYKCQKEVGLEGDTDE